jgi:Terminase large subunit, endonuclease domain
MLVPSACLSISSLISPLFKRALEHIAREHMAVTGKTQRSGRWQAAVRTTSCESESRGMVLLLGAGVASIAIPLPRQAPPSLRGAGSCSNLLFEAMTLGARVIERLSVSRALWHGGHPVLRWNASNVAVREDPAGEPDKERSTERIDGISALINALGRALVRDGTGGRFVYETQGLVPVMCWRAASCATSLTAAWLGIPARWSRCGTAGTRTRAA